MRALTPAIHFRDAAFNSSEPERFCLELEVRPQGLALVVLDNLNNDFLAFELYQFPKVNSELQLAEQLEKLIQEHEFLNAPFKRVDAAVVTEHFTLVPAALYDSSRTASYLKFNHQIDDDAVILNDAVRQCDARNIYALHPALEKVLRKINAHIRIRHHLTPELERILSAGKNKTGRKVYAHIHQGRFDLIITEGALLHLCNTYRFHTAEDFIYFLLFACEQLKLNPDSMELELSGEVETDSAITLIAKKYIRHVSFASRPVDGRFAEGFHQFPQHFYNNLFALHYFS